MKTVIVTANAAGQIFVPRLKEDNTPALDKNGKPYGSIRVEQSTVDLGFAYGNAGVRVKSALIAMSQEAWEKNGKYYKPGMEVKGTIRVLETTETQPNGKPLPGYQIKKAGSADDAETLTVKGKAIYRKTEYSADTEVQDILVQHDNVIVRKAIGETLNQKAA